MWMKEFIHDTEFLMEKLEPTSRHRVNSFHTYKLSDLQQGTGRLNFVFDEERKKNLRIGLDKILELAFENQSSQFKLRRKSNFEITEIPNKPMVLTKKEQLNAQTKRLKIPKLNIESLKMRSLSQSSINSESNHSEYQGKTIMRKLEKIEKLVKQAQKELEQKNKYEEYYHQPKYTYEQPYYETPLMSSTRQIQRNQSYAYNPYYYEQMPSYTNTNMTNSRVSKQRVQQYTQRFNTQQSRYVLPPRLQSPAKQQHHRKNKISQGEKLLLNEFKQMKGYFQELICYNREIYNNLKRQGQRTLHTEASQTASYFPIGNTNYQNHQTQAYQQPSFLQTSRYERQRGINNQPSHNRTKTQIPAHNCKAHRCCYENTK